MEAERREPVQKGTAANWIECFYEVERSEDRNVFSRLGSREGASDLTKATSVEWGECTPGWNGLEREQR